VRNIQPGQVRNIQPGQMRNVQPGQNEHIFERPSVIAYTLPLCCSGHERHC
jgi:hypothetical protein